MQASLRLADNSTMRYNHITLQKTKATAQKGAEMAEGMDK